jgi:hypothetical protein
MRFTAILTAALAVTGVVGSTWFSKAAYNKWHETELERWLADHNVPYSTPADRKELEQLVAKHWNDRAVAPYSSWSTDDLTAYLKSKGVQVQEGAESSKDSLINQVKNAWHETEDSAQQAWINSRDWILDSWSDSQLKAFCDKHGIPVPQPHKRDTLLQKARSNYETVATKLGETAAYPGDWLYQTWSDSDLKEWLDSHGYPAPQPSTRDSLIAAVRRNSRSASLKAQELASSASASAAAAYQTVTDQLIDSWSESDLKEFLDKNGVQVPQGTKANELRAIVRKRRAEILGDTATASASSAYGAASSKAGNQYAKATDSAQLALQQAFDQAVNTWSESRLKSYLDARGVPVPHASKTDELRALVRKHAHKASSGWTAWTWDDVSTANLRKYVASQSDAASKQVSEKTDATREELVSAANAAYASASSAGGNAYASATSYLSQATEDAKKSTFDTWSESELKAYLDSYGIPVPQGSTANEMRAYARKQYTYFKYGTTTPTGTLFAKVEDGIKGAIDWAARQLHLGADAAQQKVAQAENELNRAKAEAAATAKFKTDKAKITAGILKDEL